MMTRFPLTLGHICRLTSVTWKRTVAYRIYNKRESSTWSQEQAANQPPVAVPILSILGFQVEKSFEFASFMLEWSYGRFIILSTIVSVKKCWVVERETLKARRNEQPVPVLWLCGRCELALGRYYIKPLKRQQTATRNNKKQQPTTTNNNQQQPTTTNNQQHQHRPTTTNNTQPQPSTTINNHQQPPTTNNNQQQPPTTTTNHH